MASNQIPAPTTLSERKGMNYPLSRRLMGYEMVRTLWRRVQCALLPGIEFKFPEPPSNSLVTIFIKLRHYVTFLRNTQTRQAMYV
jgi:hypothetical protein